MALTAAFLVTAPAKAAPAVATPVHPLLGPAFAAVLRDVTPTPSAACGSGTGLGMVPVGTMRAIRPQPAPSANPAGPPVFQLLPDAALQVAGPAGPSLPAVLPAQKKPGTHATSGPEAPALHAAQPAADAEASALAQAASPSVTAVAVPVAPRGATPAHAAAAGPAVQKAEIESTPSAEAVSQPVAVMGPPQPAGAAAKAADMADSAQAQAQAPVPALPSAPSPALAPVQAPAVAASPAGGSSALWQAAKSVAAPAGNGQSTELPAGFASQSASAAPPPVAPDMAGVLPAQAAGDKSQVSAPAQRPFSGLDAPARSASSAHIAPATAPDHRQPVSFSVQPGSAPAVVRTMSVISAAASIPAAPVAEPGQHAAVDSPATHTATADAGESLAASAPTASLPLPVDAATIAPTVRQSAGPVLPGVAPAESRAQGAPGQAAAQTAPQAPPALSPGRQSRAQQSRGPDQSGGDSASSVSAPQPASVVPQPGSVPLLPAALPSRQAALPSQPPAAPPSGIAESAAPAQRAAATPFSAMAGAAGATARPAVRVAPASIEARHVGFHPAADGDDPAPLSLEPETPTSAAPLSRPAAAATTQAAPSHGEAGPGAHPQTAAPAETLPQARQTVDVPSGRAVKPISPGLADTAAIASATTGLADPGAGMATAAPALPDTPAGPAIGPAQPAAPANDVAAAPAGAAPPTPAAQLAQAVTSLHVGADGSSHVTIKLDPVELGQLQIRITRAPDGTASVNVAVERPQTLASLQGDLGHLHQALDRAGLPEQRSISLHLAGTDQASSQSFGSGTGGMSQGGFQQGARQERQPGSAFLPDTAGSQILPAMSDLAAPARQPPRSGVNITA